MYPPDPTRGTADPRSSLSTAARAHRRPSCARVTPERNQHQHTESYALYYEYAQWHTVGQQHSATGHTQHQCTVASIYASTCMSYVLWQPTSGVRYAVVVL